MPQTVPNSPTNGRDGGDDREIGQAALGARERFRGLRAPSPRRCADAARSPVSPATARSAARRPALAIGSSPPALAPARAARKAWPILRDRDDAFDDEHPAPDRSQPQRAHHNLADRPGLQEQVDRRNRQAFQARLSLNDAGGARRRPYNADAARFKRATPGFAPGMR